jgi:hypothetical protein
MNVVSIVQGRFRKLSYFGYITIIFWRTIIANTHLITSVDFAGNFGNYICSGDLRCSQMFLPPPPPNGPTVPGGSVPPHYRSFTITLTQPSVGILCRSDQPNAETSTCKHKNLTGYRLPCSSYPRSPQACGRRTTS